MLSITTYTLYTDFMWLQAAHISDSSEVDQIKFTSKKKMS